MPPKATDMTKPPRSLAQVNEILRREIDPSIELIKGAGYFYGNFGKYGNLPSTMVPALKNLTLEQWLAEVRFNLSEALAEQDCTTIAEYNERFSDTTDTNIVIVMDKRSC